MLIAQAVAVSAPTRGRRTIAAQTITAPTRRDHPADRIDGPEPAGRGHQPGHDRAGDGPDGERSAAEQRLGCRLEVPRHARRHVAGGSHHCQGVPAAAQRGEGDQRKRAGGDRPEPCPEDEQQGADQDQPFHADPHREPREQDHHRHLEQRRRRPADAHEPRVTAQLHDAEREQRHGSHRGRPHDARPGEEERQAGEAQEAHRRHRPHAAHAPAPACPTEQRNGREAGPGHRHRVDHEQHPQVVRRDQDAGPDRPGHEREGSCHARLAEPLPLGPQALDRPGVDEGRQARGSNRQQQDRDRQQGHPRRHRQAHARQRRP